MEIFEDSRMVSRADLAAWLRQMADQLESDGKVLFGAGGSVTVSDDVHCELEIESSGSEKSIEIEFSWTDDDEDEDEDEEEDEEQGEEAAPEAEDSVEETPAAEAGDAGTPSTTH